MSILIFIIGLIIGFIATLAIELFFVWLLVIRNDRSDVCATDYDETDNIVNV